MPAHYLEHVTEKLSEIYKRGVMEISDYDEMEEERVHNIRLYAENEAVSCPLNNIFTAKTAYEFVMDEKDTIHYELYHLQHLDLSRFISSNLRFDIEKSQQQRQELNDYLIPYIGRVKVGEKIVDRGQIVDEYTYNVLKSMEKHQQERSKTTAERMMQLTGRVLYAFTMALFILLYFQQFRNDYLERLRTVIFVTCLFLIFPLITYTLVQQQLMSVLVIPYCILPIFVRIFLDSRTAFVTHMITLFTCAIALSNPFEFLVIQTFAGLTASYSLRQLTQRSDLFTTVVLVIISTWSPLCRTCFMGTCLPAMRAPVHRLPSPECIWYAKSSTVEPACSLNKSPLGVNTKMPSSLASFTPLYLQWAARPCSAISSMRSVRICTSTHFSSGPSTVM